MRIKTKLYLSSLISVVLIVTLVLIMFLTSGEISKHNAQRASSRQVLQTVSELDILTYDYLLHHEKRAEQQWRSSYASLGKLLTSFTGTDDEEKAAIERLSKNYDSIKNSFSELKSIHGKTQSLIREGSLSQEEIDANTSAENRLTAQLLITSQLMVSETSRLAEKNVSDMLDAQTLSNRLTLALGIILLLNGIITAFAINNVIAKSLNTLRVGADEIGKGNLDYKINIGNKDEVGQVANAFNKMAVSLKAIIATKADLEKEIKERKKAEEQMKEVIRVTDAGYYKHAADNSSGFVSGRFAEILGFKLKELPKYPKFAEWLAKRIHKEDYKGFKTLVHSFHKGEISRFEHEYRVLAKNGKWLWLRFISTSLQKDAQGRPLYLAGLVFDITKREEKEKELRESEERLNKTQEIAHVGSWIQDLSSNRPYWSAETYRIYGYKPYEIIPSNKVFDSLVHPDDLKMLHNTYHDSIRKKKDGYSCMFRIILKSNGEKRFIYEKCEYVKNSSGKITGSTGMVQDITERKRVEEALKKSEMSFRAVAETARDAIISADSRGNIVYFNKGAEQIFGYSAAEVLNNPLAILMPEKFRIAHQQGFSRFLDNRKPHVIGKTVEMAGKKKDGKEFPLELSLATWNSGNETFFTAIIRDITERKNLDQRKDDFITIAGHELRTPVSAIKIMNQILQDMLAENPQAQKYLKKIEYQANIQANLINDLLSVSKIQIGKLEIRKEHFALHDLIKEIAEDMEKTTKIHKIIVKGNIYAKILADRDRIGQVLINFCSNAIKFSPKGGKIIIQLKNNQEEITVGITDYGVGIPEAYHNRIFERFYRVYGEGNKAYPGLGMGLYISYQIIKLHNGKMWFNSEPKKGSTFYFSLPLA